MPRPKKPEMVRPEPRFVVEGAGPAPKRKNPTPAKIVPDGENWALPGTDIPAGTDPFQYAAGILAGIRSLVAERDALRKLVREAYLQGALDQSHRCGLAGSKQGLERFLEKHGEH